MSQAPKASLQSFLRRLGLYNRLKSSALYTLYWTLVDKSLLDDVRREVNFYRSLLTGFREGDLIFDIGANHGYKTSVFLRLGASVLAVEPDPASKQILNDMFIRYRLAPKPVVIIERAVSDSSTHQSMWIDEPGSAKNTLSKKWVDTLRTDDQRFGHKLMFTERKEVVTTTLDELVARHGLPFFIKIDVEGHEPLVLRGLKQAVPYLSFEVNLPEFRPEGLQCVELLGCLAPSGTFNYIVDCRQGLVQKEWLGPEEFSSVLNRCTAKSIEVFWKTSICVKRQSIANGISA